MPVCGSVLNSTNLAPKVGEGMKDAREISGKCTLLGNYNGVCRSEGLAVEKEMETVQKRQRIPVSDTRWYLLLRIILS